MLEAATPKPVTEATVLEIDRVSYRYGSFEAVKDLSLTIREGEVYGFLGRNGAGKTTTIKMLMGVVRPPAGTLRYFGAAPARRATIAAKRQIGYVSQQQHFYPWMNGRTLGKFVGGLYPQWDQQEFVRLMRLFQVPMERRAVALSGGMRAKLALALALAPRPKLLILDEPMAGLDAVAQREFLDIVQDQARAQGRTIFFSSHHIHEVERISDRIGVIDSGRLVYEGTIPTLRDSIRELRGFAGDVEEHLTAGTEVLFHESRDGDERWVLRRQDGSWGFVEFPGGTLTELNLEEIFIAMVRDKMVGDKTAPDQGVQS